MLFGKKNSEKTAFRGITLNNSVNPDCVGRALNEQELDQVIGGLHKNSFKPHTEDQSSVEFKR